MTDRRHRELVRAAHRLGVRDIRIGAGRHPRLCGEYAGQAITMVISSSPRNSDHALIHQIKELKAIMERIEE